MQPLSKLKVLDFSTLLPGPFASLYLADWGADVMRIESPDREDLSRTTPPFADGVSTTHAFLNRSKKSMEIDLKTNLGQAKIREMIFEYDIILEQFRPGVMQKLGLGYEDLSALNKRLIYCSLTGYGQTGPYRDRAGHDINYAALSGLAIMTGTKSRGPILHGNPICDLAGSFNALVAILMAVYHRELSGEGQFIDVSMTDSSLMCSSLWAQMSLVSGVNPQWETTVLNGGSFYGYYRTKDDQYLSVGGLEPKFFKGFLAAIDGLSFAHLVLNEPQRLRVAIQEKIGVRTLAEWTEIFSKLDVCVEPVVGFDKLLEHPHFLARQVAVNVPIAPGSSTISQGNSQRQLGSPLKFSKFKPIYRWIGLPKAGDRV